jgi:hypothetical protein
VYTDYNPNPTSNQIEHKTRSNTCISIRPGGGLRRFFDSCGTTAGSCRPRGKREAERSSHPPVAASPAGLECPPSPQLTPRSPPKLAAGGQDRLASALARRTLSSWTSAWLGKRDAGERRRLAVAAQPSLSHSAMSPLAPMQDQNEPSISCSVVCTAARHRSCVLLAVVLVGYSPSPATLHKISDDVSTNQR